MTISPDESAIKKHRCYFAIFLFLVLGSLALGFFIGWRSALAIGGLALDIAGVLVLTGPLMLQFASVFQTKLYQEQASTMPWPWKAAKFLGNKDAADSQAYLHDEYIQTFYGLGFLFLGFLCQLISQLAGTKFVCG